MLDWEWGLLLHIGSTSVLGLAAKDLIDIQVVVPDLAVAAAVAEEGQAAGFIHVAVVVGWQP